MSRSGPQAADSERTSRSPFDNPNRTAKDGLEGVYNGIMAERDPRGREAVLDRAAPKTDKPRLYRVILHNDDYTTMEFVLKILESVFGRSPAEEYRVMMHVHTRGAGVAGVYSHEVAETKVSVTHERAREAGHPLRCSMEPE
jgi:ATP-dependent Clp protease adaptor protein ClpS